MENGVVLEDARFFPRAISVSLAGRLCTGRLASLGVGDDLRVAFRTGGKASLCLEGSFSGFSSGSWRVSREPPARSLAGPELLCGLPQPLGTELASLQRGPSASGSQPCPSHPQLLPFVFFFLPSIVGLGRGGALHSRPSAVAGAGFPSCLLQTLGAWEGVAVRAGAAGAQRRKSSLSPV